MWLNLMKNYIRKNAIKVIIASRLIISLSVLKKDDGYAVDNVFFFSASKLVINRIIDGFSSNLEQSRGIPLGSLFL